MENRLLKFGLYFGCFYFTCMAIAHYFGLKYPFLFVYYDTPFYAYQDKIISFSVVSYIALFYSAAKNLSVVPAALTVLGITVLGLSSVNISSDLQGILIDNQSTFMYWLQTGVIAVYFFTLLFLYIKSKKDSDDN